MLNQLVQIPNQLLSHLDGLVQTDSPWLDRSTIKSVASDLFKVLPPLTALVVVNIYRKSLARSSGIPARLSDSLQFPSSI